MQRKAYHHGNLPEEALKAAETLIDEHGAEGVTLRALGAALGVSHRALYRHFADLNALLDAVAVRVMHAMNAAMADASNAIADTQPEARVDAAMDAYIRFAFTRPLAYSHAMRAGIAKSSASSALRDAGRTFGKSFTLLFAAAFPDEKPANEAAITIWGTVHGLVDLYLGGTLRAENREVARAYILRLALGQRRS